jgi:T5SS/PEP-CTERM-associated repeat protein/autotransporter-associated beta strand protein
MFMPGKRRSVYRYVLAAAALAASPAWGDIANSGDVSPTSPATWTASTTAYVGYLSDGSLTVNSGDALLSQSGYLGYFPVASGAVLIDGTASAWTTSYLYAGYFGAGSLQITNGGLVSTASTGVLGEKTGASGTATVNGSGSLWTCTSILVGDSGTGTLAITNGAHVVGSGYLGNRAGSSGLATVDGIGSMWTCALLSVGNFGSGTLNITNGGLVSVNTSTFVAWDALASGLIDFGAHGGTLTTQSLYGAPSLFSGVGTINTRGLVSDGGLVFDASHGLSQTLSWLGAQENVTLHLDLTATSGSLGVVGAGYQGAGTLTIHDAMTVTGAEGYLGFKAGSSGSAFVEGAGAKWISRGGLYVGYRGTGALAISNGGSVNSYFGLLGYGADSHGTVTINGFGSFWTCNQELIVANSGAAALSITNAALVSCAYAELGVNAGSSGSVTVDGGSSTLVCTGELYVGYGGAGNLYLTNGGNVGNSSGHIGLLGTGVVTVHGSGTYWICSGNLYVGDWRAGTLAITDGGQVLSSQGLVGANAGSSGAATIDGLGSSWTCAGDLFVGNAGLGSLAISHGGHLSNYTPFLGNAAGSTGALTIDGSSSTWTYTGTLYVGNAGAATLRIINGASLNASSNVSYLGYASGSAGTAMVDGSGSIWTLSQPLFVGNSGAGTLSITNGGHVANATSVWLGDNHGSAGTAIVNGSGSTWFCNGDLFIGNSGAGAMAISAGGQVTNSIGYIGNNSGSSGAVTVDGGGSTWTCGNGLYVGASGAGTLSITNAAAVLGSASLGDNASASGFVTVDGHGSTWTGTSLAVGYSGSGTLNITHGGLVGNSSGSIGANAGSSGAVSVDGSDSTWTCNSLLVGDAGAGTLAITHGGSVAGSASLANLAGSSGFVSVDGGGSRLAAASLCVGNFGSASLRITNAGQVTTSTAALACNPGSAAAAIVDGPGSSLICSGLLSIGASGTASLAITNGGAVIAAGASINSSSQVTLNVGDASKFDVASGTLTNNGLITLRITLNAAPGDYTPIVASSITGSGTLTTLGGRWNATSHTFTVSPAATGAFGQVITLDTFTTQRVVVTGSGSGANLYADFHAASASSPMTLVVAPLSDSQSDLLLNALPASSCEINGWTFTASGYTPGNPVSLTLNIGAGYTADGLSVWHYDGTSWAPYTPSNLTYDNLYTSFIVTDLGGFALASGPLSTPISTGIVTLNANNMIPILTNLTLNGGTLDLNGHNQQLNTLSDGGVTSGLVTNTALATAVLTLAPLGPPISTAFGGLIFGNVGLTKTDAGTLTLSNYQATGPIVIAAGTLAFAPTDAPRQTPGVMLSLHSCTLALNSTMDITNHDVMIGNTNLTTIETQILAAFGIQPDGNLSAPGAPAITSSTLFNVGNTFLVPIDADALLGDGTPGSAVTFGASWDGVPVTQPGTVIVKYTYNGDANLDGKVTYDDYGPILDNFGNATPGLADIQTAWLMGDLNFDGVVNYDDYGPILDTFGLGAATSLGTLESPATSAVPEPATLLLLTLGALGLLPRRKPRRP